MTAQASSAAAAATAAAAGDPLHRGEQEEEGDDSHRPGPSTLESPPAAAAAGERGASSTTSSPPPPPPGRFEEDYELGQKLAEGSFGRVFVAERRSTREEFAVKVISRERLSQADSDNVAKEVSILRDCGDVRNIVTLVDYYESPERFYLVQVYAPGGDVFDRLAARTSYNERVARDLAHNLLDTMRLLHGRRICHRDLKPENLLLRSAADDAAILVADFGFAAHVPPDGLKTRCGTPAFVAPEVLVSDGRYDERCDCWSVGCLLYMLIGGYPPFQAPNHRALFRKIRGADFCFHDQYWRGVSLSAKQLIASLLTTDPKFRCTAAMALDKSSWLRMPTGRLEGSDLTASLAEIRSFKARASLKGAVHTVLWSVRQKFRAADPSGFARQVTDWNRIDEEEAAAAAAMMPAEGTDGASSTNHNSSTGGGGGDDGEPTTTSRPTLKFEDVYELRGQLYQGRSSAIWDCLRRHRDRTAEPCAVKIVGRDLETHAGRGVVDTLLHEVAVLNSLDNRHILKIIDFFDEPDEYYLVMERMDGGDVFDRILKKKRYTEKDAQGLARFLLEAVAYLHERGICHRDIKPQNLLLKSREDDAEIKVAGFGFACRVHTPQSLTKRCGTPSYVAPEILKNIPYDQAVDMWSVGCVIFVLLCGYPPFADENQNALFEKIRCGEYAFHESEWRNVSEDAKELIRNLLVVDPCRRWTARQALRCKWLHQPDVLLESADLTENLNNIKKRRSRFRAVARAVIVANSLGESISNLSMVETLLARQDDGQAPCDDPEQSRDAF